MTMSICQFHGATLSSFTTPNIAEAIKANAKIETQAISLTIFSIPGKYLVDKIFSLDHGIPFPSSEKFYDDDFSEEIFDKLIPVCSKCLKEWSANNTHP